MEATQGYRGCYTELMAIEKNLLDSAYAYLTDALAGRSSPAAPSPRHAPA